MDWKWGQTGDHWVECRGDKWVRWSNVVRVEVVEQGDFAVVLVTDTGTEQERILWKTAVDRSEGQELVRQLFRSLSG